MNHAPVTTIYIARHGKSEMNNQRLVTGQLDPALSDKGVAQSEALARLLQYEPLSAIYTSALERTAQTAAPTACQHGLTPVALAALNEINLGVLQGRHRDERDSEAAAIWAQWQEAMWRYRVPGAESFEELHQRAGAALQQILERHHGETVLIVGHSGTNRVLLGTLLGLPLEQWPALRPSNKTVHRIRLHAQLRASEPQLEAVRTPEPQPTQEAQRIPEWQRAPEHVELAFKEERNKHATQSAHAA